jgi:hypothetical protein
MRFIDFNEPLPAAPWVQVDQWAYDIESGALTYGTRVRDSLKHRALIAVRDRLYARYCKANSDYVEPALICAARRNRDDPYIPTSAAAMSHAGYSLYVPLDPPIEL